MDYSKLVKALREHSKRDNCNCDTCFAYDAEMKGYTTCSEELTEKAADAIEELQATLCNWCAVCPHDKRDLSTCEIYESCRAKSPKEETE